MAFEITQVFVNYFSHIKIKSNISRKIIKKILKLEGVAVVLFMSMLKNGSKKVLYLLLLV